MKNIAKIVGIFANHVASVAELGMKTTAQIIPPAVEILEDFYSALKDDQGFREASARVSSLTNLAEAIEPPEELMARGRAASKGLQKLFDGFGKPSKNKKVTGPKPVPNKEEKAQVNGAAHPN
jgi:hypothetical protein